MIWREVLQAVAAACRTREETARATAGRFTGGPHEVAVEAAARAQAYMWLAEELEHMARAPARETLHKLRQWAAAREQEKRDNA